jgi:hypothetical protein
VDQYHGLKVSCSCFNKYFVYSNRILRFGKDLHRISLVIRDRRYSFKGPICTHLTIREREEDDYNHGIMISGRSWLLMWISLDESRHVGT